MYQSDFLSYITIFSGISMRNIKLMYLAITLFAVLASNSLWAHSHSHRHSYYSIGLGYYGPGFYGRYGYGGYGFGGFGGYGFGGYGWGGYGYPFYYPPYYYYPPTVIVPTTPPVYIQQQVQPVQPQTGYWYYCQNPDGYYPYVRNCPGGWLQVAPQPHGQ